MSSPDHITFGILTTSKIVSKVLPALNQASKVIGVASRDPDRAQKFCDEYSCGKGMSHNDMITNPNIDAVYLPFCTAHRNEFLKKSITHGKHIYSEKPMGGTVSELAKLIADCESKGLQWMDGTMWYHSTRTKEIEKKIRAGDIGAVRHVTATFSFKADDEDWLNGGNAFTDKTREPMGSLGILGWYPLSVILWAYNWELPEKVMASHTTLNTVDTIVGLVGTLWFKGGRSAQFDCGVMTGHRSQYEIVGENGNICVNDFVGGQGRSGDFGAYHVPFVGSDQYVQGDVMGKDTIVQVEPCDHVN